MSGSKSEAHLESVNADLVDSIECRMRERLQQCGDHVTFAELRLVEEFAGDHAIFFPNANNVILWTGMSLEAIEALIRIVDNERFHFFPTSMLTYIIDGCCLDMPIAKRVSRRYVKPHWLPTVIKRGPAPYERRAPNRLRVREGAAP